MPGRHEMSPAKRSRARWALGAAGTSVAAVALLSFFPASAGASGDPVKAVFSVTGVSTSNCPVSAGGSDVYVKPGQELDVKSSVAGLTLGGLPIDVSQVASLSGSMVIDPGKASKQTLKLSKDYQKVGALTAGNHAVKWDITGVSLLGGLVPLQLGLTSQALAAGAKLSYTGTIHVTSAAAQCGVSVQVPGVGASASVTGLPTIAVSVPGVKLPTVPVSVPNPKLPSLPNLPGGGSTGGKSGGAPASGGDGNLLPVPARVVPKGGGDAVFGNVGGGYIPNVVPGAAHQAGGTSGAQPVAATAASSSPPAVVQQDSTGKHKTIDLASSKADSTGQFSVILAIVAVIALSVVAATYARLYLLRREIPVETSTAP